MLKREEGTTLEEIMAAMGWQKTHHARDAERGRVPGEEPRAGDCQREGGRQPGLPHQGLRLGLLPFTPPESPPAAFFVLEAECGRCATAGSTRPWPSSNRTDRSGMQGLKPTEVAGAVLAHRNSLNP